jgi:predicted RNA-binding Zn ribbon-like protein
MAHVYRGPLRDESLAVELHNTVYASQGRMLDGLAEPDDAAVWVAALGDRLPADGSGPGPNRDELIALRYAVRDALQATIEGRTIVRSSLDVLDRAAARAPSSPTARWRAGGPPVPSVRFHTTRRADIVIGAIAADAIDLITGPSAAQLRACDAPGCVLVFRRHHTRREWCSDACGNRARQARHYRRTHAS